MRQVKKTDGQFLDVLHFFLLIPSVDHWMKRMINSTTKVKVTIGRETSETQAFNRTYHFSFDQEDKDSSRVKGTAKLDVAFEIYAADKEQAAGQMVTWLKNNFPDSWRKMEEATRLLNDGKLEGMLFRACIDV